MRFLKETGEKAFKRAELLKECLGTLQYKDVETQTQGEWCLACHDRVCNNNDWSGFCFDFKKSAVLLDFANPK